jgi:hypothetical protein
VEGNFPLNRLKEATKVERELNPQVSAIPSML